MATKQDATEPEDMKTKQVIRLIAGITSVTLSPITWAEPPHHGAGGFDGNHFSGGEGSRPAGPRFSARPAYYYSRGMRLTNSRAGQFRSPVSRSPSFARPNRAVTNSAMGQSRASGRSPFTSRTSHIAERHDANWHQDWDRRHIHFFHNRFFVFDDGFWFGLDPGFFPWDYYPYYAYDYYPYDYYPGYYADVDPYYYSEGGYSSTPVSDPTVTAVQTQLMQLGYYNGPVDGIYGRSTRDAVARYQIANQLDVTGSLSAQTLESFGLPQPTAS